MKNKLEIFSCFFWLKISLDAYYLCFEDSSSESFFRLLWVSLDYLTLGYFGILGITRGVCLSSRVFFWIY